MSLDQSPPDAEAIKELAAKANGYGYYGKGDKYNAFNEGFEEGYKAAALQFKASGQGLKWVKTSEPPAATGIKNKVLCYVSNGYLTANLFVGYYTGREWFIVYDAGEEGGVRPCDYVTHWSLLPSAPSEQLPSTGEAGEEANEDRFDKKKAEVVIDQLRTAIKYHFDELSATLSHLEKYAAGSITPSEPLAAKQGEDKP